MPVFPLDQWRRHAAEGDDEGGSLFVDITIGNRPSKIRFQFTTEQC